MINHEAALRHLESKLKAHERDVVKRWPTMTKGDVDLAYQQAEEIKREMVPHKAALTRSRNRTAP